MPMSRVFQRALTLVLLAAVAACASLAPKLETPRVSMLGIQVMSGDMFAQRFRVRVKVENPNDIAVAVNSIEYKILLMGDSFADGSTDNSFVLPALGEAEFDMTVNTNFVSSLGRLVSRMGGGKLENVEYEIAGKLHLQKGVARTIPFDHRGTVNFTKQLEKLKGEQPPSTP
jgi:LEA14-like dessication related protein